MNARICDRCGAFYEERELNAFEAAVISINKIAERLSSPKKGITEIICAISENVDLCPECSKSFKEWFLSAKEERENNE